MAEPVRAVVFDVGGVIAYQDSDAADALLAAAGLPLTAAAVQEARDSEAMYGLGEDYSRGRMSPAAYWGAVLETLGLAATLERTELLQAVHQATVWSVVDAEVLALVRRLRGRDGLRLGILSNSAPEYERHIGAFVELFDVVHFSHRTGRRKPEAVAYQAAIEALGVPAEAAVFIDDKARNVAAAAEVGLQALHFHGIGPLLDDLDRLGLLG
jgi:putative hydrolase of the HAD superfamily